MIDPILEELQRNSRSTPEELAKLFHLDAAEITAKILRRGYKITEMPIKYVARYEHKKLSPLDGWPTLKALLKYRFK